MTAVPAPGALGARRSLQREGQQGALAEREEGVCRGPSRDRGLRKPKRVVFLRVGHCPEREGLGTYQGPAAPGLEKMPTAQE